MSPASLPNGSLRRPRYRRAQFRLAKAGFSSLSGRKRGLRHWLLFLVAAPSLMAQPQPRRQTGEGKIFRIKSFTCKDPRPLFEPVDGCEEQEYPGVECDANFSQENTVPGDNPCEWMKEKAHGSCFPQLRRNASWCDRTRSLIPAQQKQKAWFADTTQMQPRPCKLDMFDLVADPKICEQQADAQRKRAVLRENRG